ncbi:MAG: DNA primase [Candidatus Zambryskibacteria bacterium]|nr:DNA primase [Candidatus Zambryskibacteria bacterium]
MSSSVDQIKSKLDIVTVVSAYMKLDKAGSNFKGKCPFHNEKTPSFFVSPDRGSYYCFGCHNKGDIFTFVQEFEGLDFVGALKVLADRAGVTLEKFNAGEKTEKDKLHGVLKQACFFYQKKLSDFKPAQDYLKSRGVTEETIKEFRLGYAPAEWRELYEYLLSRDVTEKDMLAVGLIKKKDDNNYGGVASVYDTFRGRIMFPINDSAGRVVGFSGRILVDDDLSTGSGQANAPKYLNSPETQLFNKSEILFGLDKAKKNIRLKDYSVLVEGQMDLIMMHQVGITNTVASSGTALSDKHLIRLQRLSNRIIMAFDSDSAGFLASDRSAKMALSLGMELKITQMPEGKDPADLVKDSPETLKESIREAKHIIDFYVDNLLSRKLEPRELGKKIQKKVLPYIALLSSTIEKAHFIKNIAEKAFIKEDALWDDLKCIGLSTSFTTESEKQKNHSFSSRINSIERKIMGIIMWQKSLKRKAKMATEIDIEEMEKRMGEIAGERTEELKTRFDKEKESLLFETEAYYNDKTDLKREIDELLSGLEEEYLKKELALAMTNLQKAERAKENDKIGGYLEECQRISQRINVLKHKTR